MSKPTKKQPQASSEKSWIRALTALAIMTVVAACVIALMRVLM